jgi:arsenate reductase
MFSNTFAGIAPSSAPAFIAAQVGGGIAGVLLIRLLYPALTPAQAARIVVPHETGNGARPEQDQRISSDER